MRKRRNYIEFEDDDGTVLRYYRHPNGEGLVEATADVHSSAWVDRSAYVDPEARVHASARVAAGAWVDRGAVVEEDAVVGTNAHLGAGAVLSRGARLRHGAVVGPRVRVTEFATIAPDTVVTEASLGEDRSTGSVGTAA